MDLWEPDMQYEWTESGLLRLTEDYIVDVPGIMTYTLPAGFESDGASIPRVFWRVLRLHPYHPDLIDAALVHDHMCESAKPAMDIVKRAIGDLFFLRLLKKRQPLWKRICMWGAVFGYSCYWKIGNKK